jgi:hypothetical protein
VIQIIGLLIDSKPVAPDHEAGLLTMPLSGHRFIGLRFIAVAHNEWIGRSMFKDSSNLTI